MAQSLNRPSNAENMTKVANVEVTLCAELGRTTLPLKDIIEYDTGSIIPLDKMSDESIDIFVDDILIAKGKVVALEDSYGVKIVEIVENQAFEKGTNDKKAKIQ